MTLEQHRSRHDLLLALRTAESMQATIRHADAKAQVLLGFQGGMAVVVLQQMPALARTTHPALLATAGVAASAWLIALAVGAWYLMTAMTPRLAGPHPTGEFGLPSDRLSKSVDPVPRDAAWNLARTLAGIALAKHSRVRRSMVPLIMASVSASALIGVSVVSEIAA
ncbi:hypothetical protein AMIS_24160 [Actinoplanes missouriensis 431]|uniref:Pycsar effector protein domain-containing protein n=1 Tax=Actinoplanes missouriensis (strain ATCC 14538 / DSM 43046 / CBS 188.64 / JCM 3121 / NBRC 102363 / NCIMB 12654 / NRRL B-3342 / UNCC 431) TaxID=512565 RepID=I0H3P9_ACTM4|nr:hypothetical protein [Actinoplanes missouriensis]BAL87636.1 hypothetical protein AMIS_24160 [Actinoplanes missouriensis 431]